METTKNKVKFNFFDVAVIIIMALVLTGFSYIYFLGGNNSAVDGSKTNLEYVLQIEMADEGFGGLVKVGDIVKVAVLDVDEKRHRIGLTMKGVPKDA